MAYRPNSKIVQVIEHKFENATYDENRHIFLVLCEDDSIWQCSRNFDDNPVWSEIIPCIQ